MGCLDGRRGKVGRPAIIVGCCMGVTCSVHLVDWPEFLDRLAATGDPEEAVAAWAAEPLPSDSLGAQLDFLNGFDASRRGWPEASAAATREVFDHLFWSWRGARFKIDDVGGREMDGIETAWSPATVARFAAAARAIDLEAGRAAFRPGDQSRFEEAGEFIEYGEAWLRILREGAASGRGLVVIAFG